MRSTLSVRPAAAHASTRSQCIDRVEIEDGTTIHRFDRVWHLASGGGERLVVTIPAGPSVAGRVADDRRAE